MRLKPEHSEELDRLQSRGYLEPYEHVRVKELHLISQAFCYRFGPREQPQTFYSFLEVKGIDLDRSIIFDNVEPYQGYWIEGKLID